MTRSIQGKASVGILKRIPSKTTTLFLTFITLFFSHLLHAAPSSELLKEWNGHDESNTQSIDHSLWQKVLDTYLKAKHPSGINRVDYLSINHDGAKELKAYIKMLADTDPLTLNRAEQKAYWINLYNALTVELVAEEYPVKSITKLGEGLFSFGPWNDELIHINGKPLTLNNIEHGILRPIYNDQRIHYAVNCASIGCPNLSKEAFTASNTEELLERATSEYINHPRGVKVEGGDIIASSIYDWYGIDFGGTEESLLGHWEKYANPKLKAQLKEFSGDMSFEYDWGLNKP